MSGKVRLLEVIRENRMWSDDTLWDVGAATQQKKALIIQLYYTFPEQFVANDGG
jgi:hypothetical protein